MRALTPREMRVLVYFGILLAILGWDCLRRRWSPGPGVETEHYSIESSATPEQTREIGRVAEILYRGYSELAAQLQYAIQPHPKLKMRLFKDRDEFRLCNRVRDWAEGFYRKRCCYQYYSAEEAHPYHWMMHEATHQLNAEAARLKLPQWLDEGLACYLSTSRIIDDSLALGRIDTNTYPVWWLDSLMLTGDLEADKESVSVIPLRAIVSGRGGPGVNKRFNLYYLHWWSLVHFLMEHENGAHRAGLAQVIAVGGTLTAFEKHIGPIESIERQWYNYRLDLKQQLVGQVTPSARLKPAETTEDNE
ncbi:MAG: hypothetical protein ABFE13_26530 [Phycisphaerales bacterium]